MINVNNLIDREESRLKHLQIVQELFIQNNIEECQINFQDIQVENEYNDNNQFIHTINISQNQNLPFIVFIHGYGGASYNFYKLAQYFVNDYQILMIDLPGMGFSSTHKFFEQINTTEKWLDHILNSIQQVLDKKQINKFQLLGHSMGALISFHLFKQLKEWVLKLILFSPAGFLEPNENYFEERKQFLQKQGFLRGLFLTYIEKKVYEEKKHLFSFVIKPFRSLFLKKYLANDWFSFNQEEIKQLQHLLNYTLFRSHTGYVCFPYLLIVMKSHVSIAQYIGEFPDWFKDILIIYGQRDWMDYQETLLFLKDKQYNIEYQFIEDGDHQLQYNHHFESQQIINDFFKGILQPNKVQPLNNRLSDNKPAV